MVESEREIIFKLICVIEKKIKKVESWRNGRIKGREK